MRKFFPKHLKYTYFLASPKDLLIDFLEGGERGREEGERNVDEREKHGSVVFHMHPDQVLNL